MKWRRRQSTAGRAAAAAAATDRRRRRQQGKMAAAAVTAAGWTGNGRVDWRRQQHGNTARGSSVGPPGRPQCWRMPPARSGSRPGPSQGPSPPSARPSQPRGSALPAQPRPPPGQAAAQTTCPARTRSAQLRSLSNMRVRNVLGALRLECSGSPEHQRERSGAGRHERLQHREQRCRLCPELCHHLGL